MRVTVWNEYRHEKQNPAVSAIYPDGIHAALAAGLKANGITEVRTVTLDDPIRAFRPMSSMPPTCSSGGTPRSRRSL